MPAGPVNDSGITPATRTSVLFNTSVKPASGAAPSLRRQNRSPTTTDGGPSARCWTRSCPAIGRRVDHREVIRGDEQDPRRFGDPVVPPGDRLAAFGADVEVSRAASANRSYSGIEA
jgi:hypothetical protein